ncbi:MAG: FHA domain-containing protein [Actinomycetota bacterium]|nr:FHA domain-containing protein [Actinomycetota bacterium]
MKKESKNSNTESIKDKKVEHDEYVSTSIIESINKMAPGKSGLFILKGPNVGDNFLIDKQKITIGRIPESDIFLDDITVSRKHAEIIKKGEEFVIKDFGSLNGSYVNGKLVDSAVLNNMDKIQIGKYIFLFFNS